MSDLDLILDLLKALLPTTPMGAAIAVIITILIIVVVGSLAHYIYVEYTDRKALRENSDERN